MSLKNKWRRLIASVLIVTMILSASEAGSLTYAKTTKQKSIASTYLNVVIKYLYVGDEKEGSFDFDIKKAAQQNDSTYQWYVNTKKGDPKAVSIDKKTGLVTAKKAGKAYIGCKITFSNGKSIKPEAKVIVKANPTVADSEGSVTIKTQEQLDQVLLKKDVTSINLVTKSALVFTIKEGDYSAKTLVVDAPNADVHNYGAFKNITVKAIKNSTWIEYSNGNRIYLSDSQLRIVIDNAAEVKEIVFDTPGVQADIVVNGKIENIKVLQPVDLNITGSAENTSLEVEESAKGSSLTTSVPIDVNISSEVNVVLQEGAEGTLLNRTNSDINVGVDNMTQQDIKLMTNEQGGETIAAGTSTIVELSPTPTTKPTATPKPTTKPTVTPKPTTKPTVTPKPNTKPTVTPAPTTKPTVTPKPATKPTVTPKPTATPAITPTAAPTAVPAPYVPPANVPTQTTPTNPPAPVDNTAPTLTGVSLSTDQKIITLTFNEAIVNNCADMAALKNQITFTADNKTTANGLALKDSISINDKKLIIVQDSPVYQEEVKLYIAAASLKDTSGNIINSTLTTNVTGNDNTTQNASGLTVDSDAVLKEINPSSDVDWFSFHAEAGQAYRITAASLTNELAADSEEKELKTFPLENEFATMVSLYSADGSTKLSEAYGHMIYKDSSAYVTNLDCAFVTAGTYYIKVINQTDTFKSYKNTADVKISDEAASTGGLYKIAISKTDGMASEPDNTPASASIIQPGTKKTGQWIMPASDIDYYKFDAKANETYYIRAYGDKEDIYLLYNLYDTDGVTVIKSAEDYGLIEFTPLVSKTYYLSINAEVDPDYSNVGTYRLVLDSNESRATAAVIVAENVLKSNPLNAREPFYNAQSLIAEIADKNVADALSARLNAVKAGIDAALLATFNGSVDSNGLLYLTADLQLTSFSSLSSTVQSDVIVLLQYDYPLNMGLRGFTSMDEVKEALNKTITKYNNWLNTVNSAADATAMKTALNAFAGIYNISVTDLYANVVFNERGSGYASITAIKAVKTTAVVTFNTVLYTPKTEYPYYDFSTGGGGVITATVSGAAIQSGALIEKGKTVVFNYTPETGYEAFSCIISGTGGPSTGNEYTVSNVTNDVSLELRVKKATSITIDAPTSYSRASTDDLIIKYTCQNTYFIGVYGPLVTTFPVELIKSGDATVVDGGVKISRKYLSNFLSQGSIYFQVSFAMEYKDIYINITD